MMKLGYAQSVITPSLDRRIFLAGFGQDRIAETIHDDLYVRSLALNDGLTTLVLAAVDILGLFRPDVLEVKKAVLDKYPSAQIIVAATHTHHGPDTMGLWGPNANTSGVDSSYMALLKAIVVSTIIESIDRINDCDQMKATSIRITGLVKNTRDPGLIEDELVVMQFLGNHKPMATLFNFPCHPETLWEHNPHITSDYPGYLRAEVEKATNAPCIFFSGSLGGMLTPDVNDHSFEEAEQMGKTLAFSGLLALERPALTDPAPKIVLRTQQLSVKLTNILYKYAFLQKLLPDTRDKKGFLHSEVNLAKIGQAWFATVPGELLPKLGILLKSEMARAGAAVSGVIGLANDELGYMLPAEDFKFPLNPFKPGSHYEETNSVSKDIGAKVVDAVKSLL